MKPLLGLLSALALAYLPATVTCCSCVEGSFDRSEREAIQDDLCSQYSPDIYVATVTAASCNCMASSEDADLYCNSYTAIADSQVNSETTGRAACEDLYAEDLSNCSLLTSRLVGGRPYLACVDMQKF